MNEGEASLQLQVCSNDVRFVPRCCGRVEMFISCAYMVVSRVPEVLYRALLLELPK